MNRHDVIARLAEIIRDVALGGDASKTAAELTDLAGRLVGKQLSLSGDNGKLVPEAAPAADAEAAKIERIFRHWQRETGKSGAQLLPTRVSKIRARLREFSERDLIHAINGALTSEFHRGDNDGGTEYLDFRTIFKNGEVVEGHIARAGELAWAGAPVDDARARRVAALRAAAQEAMSEGRTEDYNTINKQLAELLKGGDDDA